MMLGYDEHELPLKCKLRENSSTKNSEIFLAFLGSSSRLAIWLEIIHDMPGVKVIGRWDRDGNSAEIDDEICLFKNPLELVTSTAVDVVINCTSLPERFFWNKHALIAGKSVCSEMPPAENYQNACQLVDLLTDSQQIILTSSAFHGPIGASILDRDQTGGSLVFFELDIQISRRRLAKEKQGVMLFRGIDFLSLLQTSWGLVDSIWAQSRSLIRNQASEDIVTSYLKFRDGKEGIITINGLGEEEWVRLRLFRREATHELFQVDVKEHELWKIACSELMNYLHEGRTPLFGSRMVLGGFYLLDWIRQAARLNQEITR